MKFRSTAGKKVKNRVFLERIGNVGMRQTISLLRLCLRKVSRKNTCGLLASVRWHRVAHLLLACLASDGGTFGRETLHDFPLKKKTTVWKMNGRLDGNISEMLNGFGCENGSLIFAQKK